MGRSVARRCAPRISENAGKAAGVGGRSNLFGSEMQVRLTLRRRVGKLLRCHFVRRRSGECRADDILINARKLNPPASWLKNWTGKVDVQYHFASIDNVPVYNRPFPFSSMIKLWNLENAWKNIYSIKYYFHSSINFMYQKLIVAVSSVVREFQVKLSLFPWNFVSLCIMVRGKLTFVFEMCD